MNNISVNRRTLLLAGAAAGLAACTSDADVLSEPATSPDTTAGTSSSTTGATTPASDQADTTTPEPDSAVATDASGDDEPAPNASFVAADFESLGSCMLAREMTAGPYGLAEQFDRRDITEGYPGHPLRLGLRVVDAACEPVPGATVEIWHADSTGDYSAFNDNGNGKDEGPGTTFLRGSQTAGDDGIVEFQSVYPGWYPGRAVHIHVRVFVAGGDVLTSQLFFADDYTASIFATGEYASNGLPDRTVEQDRIAGSPAQEGTLLALRAGETPNGAGTIGLLNLGVNV